MSHTVLLQVKRRIERSEPSQQNVDWAEKSLDVRRMASSKNSRNRIKKQIVPFATIHELAISTNRLSCSYSQQPVLFELWKSHIPLQRCVKQKNKKKKRFTTCQFRFPSCSGPLCEEADLARWRIDEPVQKSFKDRERNKENNKTHLDCCSRKDSQNGDKDGGSKPSAKDGDTKDPVKHESPRNPTVKECEKQENNPAHGRWHHRTLPVEPGLHLQRHVADLSGNLLHLLHVLADGIIFTVLELDLCVWKEWVGQKKKKKRRSETPNTFERSQHVLLLHIGRINFQIRGLEESISPQAFGKVPPNNQQQGRDHQIVEPDPQKCDGGHNRLQRILPINEKFAKSNQLNQQRTNQHVQKTKNVV